MYIRLLIYSFIKSKVSKRTMHNNIQYYKSQYGHKTALISIVKEHACYKITFIRGGC